MKDLITNWYVASSGSSFNTIHRVLATHHLETKSKETKGSVSSFQSGFIRHLYSKKIDKNLHIHSKMRTFHSTAGREIDKEVIDGIFHAEEIGNKSFEAFSLENLVEHKNSFLNNLSPKKA